MYDSSLFDNLKLISRDDWKEFRLFVDSDFNNRGSYKEETRWLCDYISGVYPDFQHKKLKKEKVLSALFKDTPVISGKLEKIMHELNNMCRNYLIWKSQNSEENSFYRDLEWLKILRESLDEDRYLLFMEKARKKFNAIEKVSPEYYYQKYLLEKEWHEWLSTVNRMRDDLNLPKVLDSINNFYTISSLELSNHMFIQKRVTKIDISYTKLGDILTKYNYDSSIIHSIYYKIHLILEGSSPTESDFNDLIKLVFSNEDKIDIETLKIIYSHIRNICNIIIDSNKLSYLDILHDLQRKSLEKGFMNYQNKISGSVYISITKTAIDTGNYAWALDFIEKYKNSLMENQENESFYLINKSLYLFAIGNYHEALKILPQYSKNIYYHLFIRKIEIKSSFELKSDLLPYKLDSFKMFLRRSHLKFMAKTIYESHLNFTNLLIQIIQIPPRHTDRIIRTSLKLQKSLQNNERLVEKKWLLEKVSQLK